MTWKTRPRQNPGFRITGGNRIEVQAEMLPYHIKSWGNLSLTIATEARYAAAFTGGHSMTDLVDDASPGCYICYCRLCDGFVVTDLIESETAFGRAVGTKCPGKPEHSPAERRSVMDMATGTTSEAREPMPTNPVVWPKSNGTPHWSDPETQPHIRKRAQESMKP